MVLSMRVLLFLGLLLLLTFAGAKTVVACDCVTPSPNESFQNADVVFEGEVIRSTQVKENIAYTFKITNSLKGLATSEVTLFQGHTNCDPYFWPNVVYRVYAKKFEGRLISGVCSGNKVLKTRAASQTLAAKDISPWRDWHLKVGLLVGVSILLCLFIWFLPGRK